MGSLSSNEILMRFHKRECLKRAKDLVAQQNDAILRYACLELRFCIEAIAYEKLQTYSSRLPAAVLETWQPPQALRALLEFEPLADQDFTLTFCVEDESGQPTGAWRSLGTHKTFRLSWLKKTYNALGNHLHVPTPLQAAQHGSRKTNVQKLVTETINTLDPIIETTVDCSIASVVEFPCTQCSSIVIRNREGLERDLRATCLNPNCRAEYQATKDGDNGAFQFTLNASSFACCACEHPIMLETRKLEIGLLFTCPNCKAKHQVAKRQWGYGLVTQPEQSPQSK
jgi:hypothetical protein